MAKAIQMMLFADVHQQAQAEVNANLLRPQVFQGEERQDHQGNDDHRHAEEFLESAAQVAIDRAPAEPREPDFARVLVAAGGQPGQWNQALQQQGEETLPECLLTGPHKEA
jgi:hypothetical protein